jgi:Family of unknown function (DUF5681)
MGNDTDDRDNHGRNSNGEPNNDRSNVLSAATIRTAKQEVLGRGVGYRSPPQHTRFMKGQSGNPNGRPRKQNVTTMTPDLTPSAQDLLQLAEQLVSVREGETVRQITMLQALNKAQVNTALKGNAFAQKCASDRIEAAQRAEAMAIERSHEAWLAYQLDCRNAIETARRKGAPLPEFLPHPDDLAFEHGKRVRITGPVDAWSQAKMQETIQVRDTLLLQYALDTRKHVPKPGTGQSDLPYSAGVAALMLNDGLPERVRLSDDDIFWRVYRYERIPRLQLLKQIFAAWRALGRKVPRGTILPPVGRFMDAFDERMTMVRQFMAEQQAA